VDGYGASSTVRQANTLVDPAVTHAQVQSGAAVDLRVAQEDDGYGTGIRSDSSTGAVSAPVSAAGPIGVRDVGSETGIDGPTKGGCFARHPPVGGCSSRCTR
jgi:hypothetical protein